MRSIRLLKNYRSTPEILRCALPVISENEGSQRLLKAQHPSGALVRCVTAESDLSEGIYIAKEINRMVGGIDMLDSDAGFSHAEDAPPRSFSDIAVLYRTHRQADLVEKCLRREGIPCVIAGRDDFLADDAVRGAVSFFHFLLDVQNDPALRACLKLVWNCPADLIGSLAQFFAQAAKWESFPGSLGRRCNPNTRMWRSYSPSLRRWRNSGSAWERKSRASSWMHGPKRRDSPPQNLSSAC